MFHDIKHTLRNFFNVKNNEYEESTNNYYEYGVIDTIFDSECVNVVEKKYNVHLVEMGKEEETIFIKFKDR
jgi:hypothetical protein